MISNALKASPIIGEEELIKWSEYAAQFPQLTNLQILDTAGMPLLKYLSIDVIFLSSFFFIFIVILIWQVIKLSCRKKESKKTEKHE